MESNVDRVANLARYGDSQGITMVSQDPDARFSHRIDAWGTHICHVADFGSWKRGEGATYQDALSLILGNRREEPAPVQSRSSGLLPSRRIRRTSLRYGCRRTTMLPKSGYMIRVCRRSLL